MSSSKSPKPEIITNLQVPVGISITESNKIISVNGKLGNISKDFTRLPATLLIQGDNITIKPYGRRKKDLAIANTARIGERSARISRIHGRSTKVVIQGDDVVVSGPNLEEVSQTAADIEASTKVKNKDRRVFLDGLYIYHKGK